LCRRWENKTLEIHPDPSRRRETIIIVKYARFSSAYELVLSFNILYCTELILISRNVQYVCVQIILSGTFNLAKDRVEGCDILGLPRLKDRVEGCDILGLPRLRKYEENATYSSEHEMSEHKDYWTL